METRSVITVNLSNSPACAFYKIAYKSLVSLKCHKRHNHKKLLNLFNPHTWKLPESPLYIYIYIYYSPSRTRRIVKICDVVDLFLRKPFWFFLSIFSILGSMRLRRRALYILTAMDIRVIPRLLLANRGITS